MLLFKYVWCLVQVKDYTAILKAIMLSDYSDNSALSKFLSYWSDHHNHRAGYETARSRTTSQSIIDLIKQMDSYKFGQIKKIKKQVGLQQEFNRRSFIVGVFI